MASEKSDSAEPAAAKSNQLYVFFGHESSSVLYSMYEIPVPNPLPPPPTKSAQIAEMQNPSPLPNTTPNPILKLKRGEYPRGMCCVQLGSKFYFFGGEYDDLDHAYVAKDVKTKYKNVKRDRYPRDVYVFDPTNTNTNTTTTIDDNKKKSMMISGTPMQTGKAKPLGFVVDEKIYVVGSTFTSKVLKNVDEKNSDIKKHVLFEVYDLVVDKWSTLPTPSHPLIRDSEPEETEWVGHAVVGRKVLLHNQSGYGVLQHRLYCYDLDRGEWINYENLPSYSGNFLGRSEFVGDTLYGVYNGKVSAIAQLADADEEEEEEEEEENMGADAENPLYFPSEDLCSVVDAIYHEYPPKQDSSITSSTLLHLGNGVFCFVMSGRTLHRHGYYAIEDNKKGVISIVIFQALGDKHLRGEGEDEDEYEYSSDEDEDEGNAGFFRAKFLYSAHYHINIRSRNLGDIHGCFTLGLSFNIGDECDPNCAEHGKGPMFEPFKEVKKELDLVPTVPQLSLARQKYSDDCEAAVNEQINVEYNVSYVYHAMFAYFDRDNVALKGIAKFFKESSEEERDHAEKFMEYQNKRGGRVRLQSIVMPLSEFDHAEKGDALYAMELALSLEKLKNEKLLNLHSLADRNNDVQLADFVESEFLTEQVEAIKKISEYVAQLRRVGKGHGTWHFDQMLLDEA